MSQLHIASEAEREMLAEILAHSFAFPVADAPLWFERAGHDQVHVFTESGRCTGGLITIPMGQWFGERSVPMVGVAGVGTAPEHRGAGVGTAMMCALVRDLYARGVALSTLYPATVPLYQRAGYERAGARYETSVVPRELPTRHDPALRFVRLDAVGDEVTGALYNRMARPRDGWLDRGPYIWTRINAPFKSVARCHGVEGPEGLEGYVVIAHKSDVGHDTTVTVIDAVAATPRANEAALCFIGAYRSLATQATWYGAPHDALTLALRDRWCKVAVKDYWMLRITHVAKALAARGYNRALTTSLTLTVTDDVVPENAGSYLVEVTRGEASVTRTQSPGLRLDVRALAALYAGFRSAASLAADGLAAGSDDDIARADLAFRATSPAMSDGF